MCLAFGDLDVHELGALDLHRESVDGLWGMIKICSSKVNNDLFCFVHVEVVGGTSYSFAL